MRVLFLSRSTTDGGRGDMDGASSDTSLRESTEPLHFFLAQNDTSLWLFHLPPMTGDTLEVEEDRSETLIEAGSSSSSSSSAAWPKPGAFLPPLLPPPCMYDTSTFQPMARFSPTDWSVEEGEGLAAYRQAG